MAYARAYNRWIVDFCADSGGRLLPVAAVVAVALLFVMAWRFWRLSSLRL